jgi:SnoaL-like domain
MTEGRKASDRDAMQDVLDRLAVLEERVARTEAHAAILDLKSRYGALADARYSRKGPRSQPEIDVVAEELAALFTADAVWEGGGALGRCEGRESIRARFREPTLHYAWHFFVKPEIRVEGDRAQGTWDVLAIVTTKEGRAMWMVGVEHDEYARIGGRWLHARMRLDSQLMAPHDRGWAPPSRQGSS